MKKQNLYTRCIMILQKRCQQSWPDTVMLALNRGEKEKFLTVKIEAPEEEILRYLEKKVIHRDNPYTTPVLKEVVADSYQTADRTGDRA